ncbi:hypothetical protein BP6252_02072 [Coleophoma cylindrospora]|uniref:Cutinase n=1 Tax=Coleophoma cylindrospora TaxID=1849047 RepID=A0A3D8SDT5_9HELO|nr:hypothetical protein BP6252_02072 [Coleophoma cylindrospora]
MLTAYTILFASLMPFALAAPTALPQTTPQISPDTTLQITPDATPNVGGDPAAAEAQLAAALAATNTSSTPPAVADTSSKTGCSDMTLIFARGTTETGDLGSLVGPQFVAAIQSKIGSATLDVQGVPAPAYTADIPGFLAGGSASGSKAMADMVTKAMTACPKTKIVMSGYSQGGQLVHNAAKMLPASTMAKVNAAVIFGDPDNGAAVTGLSAANTKVICHTGDNICAHGDLILTPHLTYSMNAPEAAAFVSASAGIASKA